MNLTHLKQFVPSRVFQRDEDYFVTGLVQNFLEKDAHTYCANVNGTECYSVHIELNVNLEILSSSCDCPHVIENFCKHQVALCLKILDSHSLQSQVIPANSAVR